MAKNHDPSSREPVTRRDFVRKTSAAVAGGVVASRLPRASAAQAGGSDVLRVGIVGCGGRGGGAGLNICSADKQLAEAGVSTGRVEIVAAADAFRERIDGCLRRIGREHADRIRVSEEHKFVGLDAYKSLLASDVDVVILTTPPGFRPLHFEAAVEAGKQVFMEKPVAVDPAGIRRVLAAGELAREKGLAVGVGLQRRHDTSYLRAIDQIHSGGIGEIPLTRVYWNSGELWVRSRGDFARAYGRAPNELEYQVNNWYYFNWLCGDHIVEQHIHNLDVSNWATGMLPVSANGMGGRERRTGRDHGQIFDHHFVEFTYPNGATMMSQCRHQNGCWTAVHEEILGSSGSAKLGLGKPCTVTSGGKPTTFQGSGKSALVNEHVDLLKAIRSATPYNEAEYGATSTMTAILGRMATYSGKKVTWDEAIASEISLAPTEPMAWDAAPPVVPDEHGRYPIPVPGETVV